MTNSKTTTATHKITYSMFLNSVQLYSYSHHSL